MATASTNKTNIDQLNGFLRGELSAVETYRMALDKLDRGSPARAPLQSAMGSHAERVSAIKSKIIELGGTPSDSSGAWGALVKAIEGGAVVLGDKMAIAALEEGEDHGLKDYRYDLTKLDGDARQFVSSRLLPEQEETHRQLSSLKKQIH